MKQFSVFLWSACLLVLFLGCQSGSEKAKEKIYDIKGKVVTLHPEQKAVTLDHEAIPGFMNAMEMKFQVEEPAALEGLKVGDQVQGKLKVTGGAYSITTLHKQ